MLSVYRTVSNKQYSLYSIEMDLFGCRRVTFLSGKMGPLPWVGAVERYCIGRLRCILRSSLPLGHKMPIGVWKSGSGYCH